MDQVCLCSSSADFFANNFSTHPFFCLIYFVVSNTAILFGCFFMIPYRSCQVFWQILVSNFSVYRVQNFGWLNIISRNDIRTNFHCKFTSLLSFLEVIQVWEFTKGKLLQPCFCRTSFLCQILSRVLVSVNNVHT